MCLGQDAAKVKIKRMHPKEYRVHPIVFLIVLIVFPLLCPLNGFTEGVHKYHNTSAHGDCAPVHKYSDTSYDYKIFILTPQGCD